MIITPGLGSRDIEVEAIENRYDKLNQARFESLIVERENSEPIETFLFRVSQRRKNINLSH